MDYEGIILFLVMLINLVMSAIVVSRGYKNPINKYFSLMTFFNILWAGGLLYFRLSNDYEIVRFFGGFVYSASLLVVLNLFYFTLYFPFKMFKFSKNWQNIFTLLISLGALYFVFFYQKFSLSVDTSGLNSFVYEPIAYLIFTVVLAILMLAAILVLAIKYYMSDQVFKKSLLLVLVGVICGVLAGSYFNLYAMYTDNFNDYHFGPLFTLVINFVVFYLIFLKRDKKLEY
jgi:hypothetical protein